MLSLAPKCHEVHKLSAVVNIVPVRLNNQLRKFCCFAINFFKKEAYMYDRSRFYLHELHKFNINSKSNHTRTCP